MWPCYCYCDINPQFGSTYELKLKKTLTSDFSTVHWKNQTISSNFIFSVFMLYLYGMNTLCDNILDFFYIIFYNVNIPVLCDSFVFCISYLRYQIKSFLTPWWWVKEMKSKIDMPSTPSQQTCHTSTTPPEGVKENIYRHRDTLLCRYWGGHGEFSQVGQADEQTNTLFNTKDKKLQM